MLKIVKNFFMFAKWSTLSLFFYYVKNVLCWLTSNTPLTKLGCTHTKKKQTKQQ